MNTGRIHSIESFGTVDGPGIRFVVFFQGCPMRCLYCHNPDTWDTVGEGTEMTADEILSQYEGCKNFCKGGITATGGEPLLQPHFLIELFQKAKKRGIHTCLDTSGITYSHDNDVFDEIIKYTDLVMLDIKHINDTEHIKLTGHSNKNILEFAKWLDKKSVPVWIRHVVVPGITDNTSYLEQLGSFLGTLKNIKALDVLPYHTMGEIKYEKLGIEYPLKGTPPLEKDSALEARKIILKSMKQARGL